MLFVAAIVIAWLLATSGPLSRKPDPRSIVLVTSGASWLSADERGTDASAIIDNPGSAFVNVTVKVRGLDLANRVVIEKTLGPYRNVPPGGHRPIETYLDATPLESVAFDVVAVESIKSKRAE